MLLLVVACEKRDDGAVAPVPLAVRDAGAALAPVDATRPVATDAAPRGELVVTAVVTKPGTSSTVTFDAKLDLDLNFGGLAIVTSSKRTVTKKVEILAVGPDATVQKRITYTRYDNNVIVDGERKKDDTPIRGKSYRVTWKLGVGDVSRADGKPASEAEAEAVRKEESQLQSPELLGSALAGLRLVEGEPFEVPAAALEKLVKGAYRPKRVVLVYRGKTAEGARIDAEGTFANEDSEGLTLFLELKAQLVLDETGWCRDVEVTAQVRAELNGAVVGSGAGSASVKATALR
jgi:hypothetical protein